MKILIPVDGSQLSLDALTYGLRLVREGLRARFVLANVQEPASFYEIITTRDPVAIEIASAEAGQHLLVPAAEMCRAAGVDFELEVGLGDPVNMLNEIVENYQCDAVIMGARGRGDVRSALLGSVSHRMAHDAGVPVTIVKHPEPDEDVALDADALDAKARNESVDAPAAASRG